VADTLFTWRGYARTAQCQVSVYPGPPGDEARSQTVVLRELAANQGPSTISDAPYLADLVGRQLGIDPAEAYWVFHWGAFSYENATPDRDKELFLRVTFRRTDSGRLSSPYWRVIREDELLELTDRRFRRTTLPAEPEG
jgi:hypothetical protein